VRRRIASLLLVLALALGTSDALAQAKEARVALVLGNAAYREQPLKNPVNDARLMAETLRRFGFDVILREDATRDQIGTAVRDFTRKLEPGVVSLVYYAGHGIQSRGRNYLIPVDAKLDQESDLRFQAVDINALLEEVELAQPRVSLVVLDACRNNPFEKKMRGAGRGLSAVDAARGGLIAYATAPGSVAADGEGANGPYTEELVKAMSVPGLKVEEVFKRVTVEVEKRTGGQQTPWTSSSLRGDLVINLTVNVTVPPPAQAAAPAQAPGGETEMLFWRSAQASNRAEEYRAYLQQFPQGVFANLARLRVAELDKKPSVAAAPPVVPPPAPPPVVATPPASPQVGLIPPRPIEGNYKVIGTNPNGTPYSGSVRIARQGAAYEFNWNVGSVYRGVGGFQGDRLVIDWGQSSPAIYRIAPDGKLHGTWANGQGSEVLERY
jgi:uncharacterized caspase-like protein